MLTLQLLPSGLNPARPQWYCGRWKRKPSLSWAIPHLHYWAKACWAEEHPPLETAYCSFSGSHRQILAYQLMVHKCPKLDKCICSGRRTSLKAPPVYTPSTASEPWPVWSSARQHRCLQYVCSFNTMTHKCVFACASMC